MNAPRAEKPYHVPASADPADLTFEPQPMVDWFRPQELVRAGVKALLSSLFGAYADKREVQAALTHSKDDAGLVIGELAGRRDLWIDYVADLGDGFAATYAVARLVAAEELGFETDGGTVTTRRGDLLVLGGDQVYPTANREEYWNRFYGPYWAALPHVADEEAAPRVVAIPGNHDWYDGLTAFARMFCQPGRWIGSWRTCQRRSYFAVDLGHGWWLWGIDVQLGSEIDQPQIEFFRHVAGKRMQPRSKVVLATAEPSWVYSEIKGEEAYRNLEYFERKIIRRAGHEVVVGLSGDLHTYARYQEQDGRCQRFVAGGGGAYLYPTHDLPEALELPQDGEEDARYGRQTVYPDVAVSRRLARGALLFPFHNWRFATLLGGFYLVYAWIVESVSKMLNDAGETTFLQQISKTPPAPDHLGQVIADFWANLAHSPPAALVLAGLAAGLVAFADSKKTWRKLLLGGVHAVVHVALLLVLVWTFAFVNLNLMGLDDDGLPHVALFSVEMFALGGGLGGAVMGLYLYLANRLFGRHSNEVFSCQSNPDYKHFLRLHRDAEGNLTIYPIGIDTVPRWPRGWRFVPEQAEAGRSWFEPADGRPLAGRARLIEPPIEIA